MVKKSINVLLAVLVNVTERGDFYFLFFFANSANVAEMFHAFITVLSLFPGRAMAANKLITAARHLPLAAHGRSLVPTEPNAHTEYVSLNASGVNMAVEAVCLQCSFATETCLQTYHSNALEASAKQRLRNTELN